MITNFKLNVDYTKDIIGVTAEKTMRYKLKKEKKLKVYLINDKKRYCMATIVT